MDVEQPPNAADRNIAQRTDLRRATKQQCDSAATATLENDGGAALGRINELHNVRAALHGRDARHLTRYRSFGLVFQRGIGVSSDSLKKRFHALQQELGNKVRVCVVAIRSERNVAGQSQSFWLAASVTIAFVDDGLAGGFVPTAVSTTKIRAFSQITSAPDVATLMREIEEGRGRRELPKCLLLDGGEAIELEDLGEAAYGEFRAAGLHEFGAALPTDHHGIAFTRLHNRTLGEVLGAEWDDLEAEVRRLVTPLFSLEDLAEHFGARRFLSRSSQIGLAVVVTTSARLESCVWSSGKVRLRLTLTRSSVVLKVLCRPSGGPTSELSLLGPTPSGENTWNLNVVAALDERQLPASVIVLHNGHVLFTKEVTAAPTKGVPRSSVAKGWLASLGRLLGEEKPRRAETLWQLLQNGVSSGPMLARVLVATTCLILLLLGGAFVGFRAVLHSFPARSVVSINEKGAITFAQGEEKTAVFLLSAVAGATNPNTMTPWVDTGIRVTKGQTLKFRASGAVNTAIHRLVDSAHIHSMSPTTPWVGPNGLITSSTLPKRQLLGRPEDAIRRRGAVATDIEFGRLIGYVNPKGTPTPPPVCFRPERVTVPNFLDIGDGNVRGSAEPNSWTVEVTGTLWLTINDVWLDTSAFAAARQAFLGIDDPNEIDETAPSAPIWNKPATKEKPAERIAIPPRGDVMEIRGQFYRVSQSSTGPPVQLLMPARSDDERKAIRFAIRLDEWHQLSKERNEYWSVYFADNVGEFLVTIDVSD